MEERKQVPAKVREAVWKRDQNRCRKCSLIRKLEMHHIEPVAQGGKDTVDNLVLLCSKCHHEWEHLVYVRTQKITFEQWLTLPPYVHILAMLVDEGRWTNDLTAKQMRSGMMEAFTFIRELRELEIEGEED